MEVSRVIERLTGKISINQGASLSGGKSAVLSAITVALGAKANATGRANGLKSFIREGQQ